jgi:hypothetical protein
MPGACSAKQLGQIPYVVRWRLPVMNEWKTTSTSSHIPSMARLSHHAQTVTLRAKSCPDGARGLGAPAAPSTLRAANVIPLQLIFSRAETPVKRRFARGEEWALIHLERTCGHGGWLTSAFRGYEPEDIPLIEAGRAETPPSGRNIPLLTRLPTTD